MLYIRVSAIFDNPSSGFIDEYGYDLEKESVLDNDQYFIENKYDAYSLGYWPRGFSCKESSTRIYYFKAKVKRSMFFLSDILDEKFERNFESFHVYDLKRRGFDYFLDLVIHSTNETLLVEYMQTIKNWCTRNGVIKKINRIVFPEFLKREEVVQINSSSEPNNLIQDEKQNNNRKIRNWDMDSPEIEGGGDPQVWINVLTVIGFAFATIMLCDWLKSKVKNIKKSMFFMSTLQISWSPNIRLSIIKALGIEGEKSTIVRLREF